MSTKRGQPHKDPIWIPAVAARGWVIVTRDRHIQDNTAEIEAVVTHGGKMVCLSSKEAIGTWQQLEILMSNWRQIEALTSRAGPFIFTATRTSMKEIPLR